MFCTSCGNKLSGNQKFCTSCGLKIGTIGGKLPQPAKYPEEKSYNYDLGKIDKEELRKIMPMIIISVGTLIVYFIMNLVLNISVLWLGAIELLYLAYIVLFTKLLKE